MRDLQKISLECSQRLTELLEYTCLPEFKEEMIVAREVFVLLTGKINDDDFGYEQRMQLFQEYFLFEHRLTDPHPGYTIFELFLERAQATRSKDELTSFENFRGSFRSLFSVDRTAGDEVVVRDLFTRSEFLVFPLCSFSLGGLPHGQVFEGRLLSFRGQSFFSGAFIFHVSGVTSLIERMVKNFLARPSRHLNSAKPTLKAAQQPFSEDRPPLEDDSSQESSEVLDSTERWPDFLRRRYRVFRGLQNRRETLEHGPKKRAIDQLTLTRSLRDVSEMVSAPDAVTAIGQSQAVSCFVPEVPVIQRAELLNVLAQCEVRSLRYRHIEPLKVYAQALASETEGVWLPRLERGDGAEAAVTGTEQATA